MVGSVATDSKRGEMRQGMPPMVGERKNKDGGKMSLPGSQPKRKPSSPVRVKSVV
jgi:hypothetical protein